MQKEQLTFNEFHHFCVVRMCNMGPINLQDNSGHILSTQPDIAFYSQ